MKIVIDVHDARDGQEAADWLHEATENFAIEYTVIGVVDDRLEAWSNPIGKSMNVIPLEAKVARESHTQS